MWNVTTALRAPFFAFLFNHGGAKTTTNTSARGAVNKIQFSTDCDLGYFPPEKYIVQQKLGRETRTWSLGAQK